MKKIFLSLSVFFLLFGSIPSLSADECSQSCKLNEGGAPTLEQYIQNAEIIYSAVLGSLSEAEKLEMNDKEQQRNRVMASLNSILSFGEHFGSFDFKVSLPMTQEIPESAKRDYKKLESLTEKFSKTLEMAEKRGTAGVKIEDICENGVENCNFPLKEARFILIELIKNNQKILLYLTSSLQDKPELAKNIDFILVPENMKGEVLEYYNKDMLAACSQCEGEFADTVEKKIDIISNFSMGAREGIKKWKDAWILMKGGKTNPNYVETEERVLSEYMETQGVTANQAGNVTKNLEKYNEGGLSTSNPLMNSSRYAQAQVAPQAQTFQEVLEEKLGNDEKVPYAEITRVDAKKQESEDIEKTISSLYDDLIPYSIVEDTSAQELQARMIRMHYSLVRSANLLGKKTKLAETLCDKQGRGDGKCSYQ